MFLYTASIDLLVNRVDLFGKPVSLNFNGKDKSKSFIGAFFSGVVLVFFIWALYIFSQDMFKKRNPKTITSESFHANPAEMIINPDFFAFAFGLQDPVTYFHYINTSIYTVEISRQQLSRERQPDGSLSEVWSSVPLEYETCTTAHFGEMGAKFADIELNELYCLKMNQPGLDEITIQGVFESPVYQYVQASIKACDNSTSGGTCGTPEELQYYLGGGFFATYFTNTAVDPKNYETPNVKYRDSYYSSLTAPYYKEVTLYLAHLEVKSDVGWLTEDENVESFIKFERNVENLMFRQDMGAVLEFVVRVDKIKTHYERSYTKISDVFAQVNGLGSAVIIAFAFFLTLSHEVALSHGKGLRPYSDIKFNESLINELFDIKTPSDGDKKDKGGKGGKGEKKNKKAKRSNSKNNQESGKKKTLSIKNSKIEEPKNKKKEDGHHIKIDVLADKSPMNSIMNSPCDSFNISKIPLNQSPTREPQFAEEIEAKPHRDNSVKFSSPPSLSILDPKPVQYDTNRGDDQSTFRIADTIRADDISMLGGRNSKAMVDSGTYRSQLLQYKPASVKPVNKILEHYDEQSHGEIDIVLETLIQTKNEILIKKGDSPLVKKKGSFMERAGLYKTGTFKEGRDDSTLGDEELKTKAKELPEKLSKSSYKLNITFMEYLQSYFYKSKELKEKFRLLNEGVRRIEERLDIFKVFKKFREVDKMRLLMFESEQLVLFDSLPKPELALKEEEVDEELENKKSVEHIRESRFITEKRKNDLIALSYENMKRKYDKSMIDDRLLDIYDNLE